MGFVLECWRGSLPCLYLKPSCLIAPVEEGGGILPVRYFYKYTCYCLLPMWGGGGDFQDSLPIHAIHTSPKQGGRRTAREIIWFYSNLRKFTKNTNSIISETLFVCIYKWVEFMKRRVCNIRNPNKIFYPKLIKGGGLLYISKCLINLRSMYSANVCSQGLCLSVRNRYYLFICLNRFVFVEFGGW